MKLRSEKSILQKENALNERIALASLRMPEAEKKLKKM